MVVNKTIESKTTPKKVTDKWAQTPIHERLRVFGRLRRQFIQHQDAFVDALTAIRKVDRAEALTSELLPMADACRFLVKCGPILLRERTVSRHCRPMWLWDVKLVQRWDARGTVLIIGPSNYPLFLTGVQVIQALAAGNRVVVKPAPGCTEPIRLLLDRLRNCGLPDDLVVIEDETVDAIYRWIETGVELVVFTGATAHGREILKACAENVTPAIVELSGCDAAYVLDDADPELAAKAIAFGLTLNNGRTCIAPRRLFVHQSVHDQFMDAFAKALQDAPPVQLDAAAAKKIPQLLSAVQQNGSHLVHGQLTPEPGQFPVTVVALDGDDRSLLNDDLFAPVCGVMKFNDIEQALETDRACPYALGASIFSGDTNRARTLAARLCAPTVVINDMIAPTADPRVSFAGSSHSGYGATRGPDGLRAMAQPRHVAIRRSRFLPHLDDKLSSDEAISAALLKINHGTLRERIRAIFTLARSGK